MIIYISGIKGLGYKQVEYSFPLEEVVFAQTFLIVFIYLSLIVSQRMFYTNHVLTYVPSSEEVGVVLTQVGRESTQDGGMCHVDVRLFLSARNILS